MGKRVSDTGSAKRDVAGGASVRRWSMFAVLMLCAIVTGIDQLKISAVMTETESAFGLSGTQAAFLTSVFTLAGIVLAVPGAFLQRKIGAKRLLIILMACIAAGNAGSAFSGSFGLLCVFRIAEGISYAMIIMTGLTLIGMWFGGGGAGIATGIFNTFAAVANFAAMNLLPAAARRTGVRGSWILIALAIRISIPPFRRCDRMGRPSRPREETSGSPRENRGRCGHTVLTYFLRCTGGSAGIRAGLPRVCPVRVYHLLSAALYRILRAGCADGKLLFQPERPVWDSLLYPVRHDRRKEPVRVHSGAGGRGGIRAPLPDRPVSRGRILHPSCPHERGIPGRPRDDRHLLHRAGSREKKAALRGTTSPWLICFTTSAYSRPRRLLRRWRSSRGNWLPP